MSDQLIALIPAYGLWLLALVVFLSCLALPVPSSLVMLASGSFAGVGELSLAATFSTALLAAILGDQTGYQIGRQGARPLLARLTAGGERRKLYTRAERYVNQNGGIGVFLSRWLFSPLGPYVNFIGGATGLNWLRFTLWGATGELVWVSLYVGLGATFADNLTAAAELAGDFIGVLAAGVITLLLGRYLWKALGNPK